MITTLGKTLRVARKARHLTLTEVATATGISNTHLSRLENGRIEKPGRDILAKLAQVYSIPDQILFDLSSRGASSDRTELSRTVLQLVLNAAEVLTEEDWLVLQSVVEGIMALRRVGSKSLSGKYNLLIGDDNDATPSRPDR
ncbi:helix-turn-helix domain-containing protein [Deinococcus sp. QL22]|uniref:helix-turn-helix domain-containing protein n=1 Tax=Deinococcus sp. QL22 TaxID=2939437 RepID=UPI002018076A|nr:helix-turn-helix transcriptional regulator [Deinococcus sp. QL22]UQN09838.1 helix-turn-helix domain-containing protein [Deinococcus sp. QL22]